MPTLLLALLTAALLCSPLAAAAAPGDDRLPTDPALVTGTLPNGLAYIIRPHKNPEGRVSIWLNVATGSLNETDATRGIAHYLEHMAFNGSSNFPPGSVVPFFQSLGLAFGRDQNAFTSFDQTAYQLTLPGTSRDLVDKGMLFMSDVAQRLNLSTPEIDGERQIILEEKRARASARQRVQDQVYEHLAPESTLGRRLPIGTEEAIKAVTRPDFVDYYSHWYVPSNMTVIVVGDADPAMVADVIAQRFGSGAAVPPPAPRPVGVAPAPGQRAIVATDSELTEAEISIVRIEPPHGPATTAAEKRRDIVDLIGAWSFGRRMSAEIAAGRVSFLDAGASVADWTGAMRMSSVEASGRPGTWRTMLTELGAALQRARLYGFSEREVEDARAALIAQGEEAVQRETTRPARDVLRQINGAVNRREPVMSAGQSLALLRQLLPGITSAEVSQAFAASFEPSRALFIAELPASDGVPTESELVALGRAAVDVRPDKLAEVARPTALLGTLPAGGTVVESTVHPASGVTSMWLDNGVRLHHRFMDQRKHVATISIALAGGQIQETPANRGVTEAALRAWDRPATSALSSTQIRDLMTGAKAHVRAGMSGDTLTLVVSGDPDELERGLQLAYLLLTDPVIEPAGLEQWKDSEIQRIAARKSQPMQVLATASADAIYPRDETRPKWLTAAQVHAITRDAAQAWLRQVIASSPVEVSVVGDIDREAATRMVAHYLGALPARPRVGAKTFAEARAIARPAGPTHVQESIDAKTPQAAVLAGFFGPDLKDTRDIRLLNLAARVLTTRMTKTIREDKQLVYSIGASSEPAVVYPGFGLFASAAPTDPAKAAALASAVEAMYADFAKDGPTADELAVAKKQMANQLDELLKMPEFWSNRLATMDYRGQSLDDLLGAQAEYQRFSADEVREAFVRYDRPDARLRVVIVPR
ncbi:MAG TPA: insulinase family protein [Candidatus Methylomirabilis sp.]|nr:insulinase family protein [Candidatus Methylomirabilis sp.]